MKVSKIIMAYIFNFLIVGSGFIIIKGPVGFWIGIFYLSPFIILNVFREDVGWIWALLVMILSYLHLSFVIKNEGKENLRKEHFKQVDEAIQMAKQLHYINEGYGKIMADHDAKEQAHFLSRLIAELEDTKVWLDKNNYLPHKKASELLEFHKALTVRVKQIEYARNTARKMVE